MNSVSFLFRSPAHSSSAGREGIDAVLACAALTDDIQLFFIGAGVTQLVAKQDVGLSGLKDYAPMLKLFDLYDIENIYVCESSLAQWGLAKEDLLIDVNVIGAEKMSELLRSSRNLLSF